MTYLVSPFTAVVCLFLMLSSTALSARDAGDLYEFLANPIGLSSNEIQGLKADKVIIKLLEPQAKHEVVILGVARVNVPISYCLNQYGKEGINIETSGVEAKGKFSDPAVLADIQNLMLPPADTKDLMKCKSGDCKMKVPETAFKRIAQLKQAGDSFGSKANAMFQEAAVDYVNAYLKKGNTALIEYYDNNPPVKLADEFKELLGQTDYLYQYVPELHAYLEKYPHVKLANAKNVIYWKKEIFGKRANRPVISLNHFVLFERPGAVPEVIAAGKQLYATHYFEAAFEVTAMEKDPEAPETHTYLIFINRARLDVMRKLPGFLKRAVYKGAKALFYKKMSLVKKNLEQAHKRKISQ
jgi:hypothetical protein